MSEAISFCSVPPLLINVHGGRDGWPREQQEHYFTQVLEIAEKYPVTIVHETHRGRSIKQNRNTGHTTCSNTTHKASHITHHTTHTTQRAEMQ